MDEIPVLILALFRWLREALGAKASRWMTFVLIGVAYFGNDYMTDRRLAKNLEERRIIRCIDKLEIHHGTLNSLANTYALMVTRTPDADDRLLLVDSVRDELLHLRQNMTHCERLFDAPSDTAVNGYVDAIERLDNEIAKAPDANALKPFGAALAALIEAEKLVAHEIKRQFGE